MDIKTFNIPRTDLEYVLCWWPHKGGYYYIQALEFGEWVEDFSDLPHEQLPETRDDAAAIRATKAYVDHVAKEILDEGSFAPQPDWEAQARYDEIHGTVNGEDPNIAAWREAFPYGG